MRVRLCTVEQSIKPLDIIVEMPYTVSSKFGKHVSRQSPDMTP